MDVNINENESIDDLDYKGLKLIQKKDSFRFGVDAVLLSDFADVKKGSRVADLGTGTGIVPVLLAGKTQALEIVGLEIQVDMAEMASRSVVLNGLQERVNILQGDIMDAKLLFPAACFDVVTSNPPYKERGTGLLNPKDAKAVSRHEILCTLEDVVSAAAYLLKPGGQFVMVHRPQRLADIMCLMRQYRIEPKYLRFVHPSPYKKPNLLLVKGQRGGGRELKMVEPLYVYDETGNYSKEINEIYNRGAV